MGKAKPFLEPFLPGTAQLFGGRFWGQLLESKTAPEMLQMGNGWSNAIRHSPSDIMGDYMYAAGVEYPAPRPANLLNLGAHSSPEYTLSSYMQ